MGERNHFIYSYLREKVERERRGEKEREGVFSADTCKRARKKLCFLFSKRFRDIIMKRGGRNNATRKHSQKTRESACDGLENVHVGQWNRSCFWGTSGMYVFSVCLLIFWEISQWNLRSSRQQIIGIFKRHKMLRVGHRRQAVFLWLKPCN